MTVFCWCDDGFDETEGGGSGFRPAEFKASGESGAEKRRASRFFLRLLPCLLSCFLIISDHLWPDVVEWLLMARAKGLGPGVPPLRQTRRPI